MTRTSPEHPSSSPPASVTRAPVTAIILTCNEAANIAACLRSLDWVDEIVLVDSGSSDETLALARSVRTDARVLTHAFEDFGAQRDWALDHAAPRHPWVLFLDADERSHDAFAAAVRRAIAEPGEKVGFYLCARNYFFGQWLKRCTLFPSWQLRLLRVGEVRYRKEGHGQREVTEGALGYLREPYDHYPFSKGVRAWIDRHNVYSSEEVELIRALRHERLALKELFARDAVRRRRCLKRLAAKVGFRPLLRFVYLYVLRLGFLDGRAGLHFCLLWMAYDIHITVKLVERERNEDKGS